MENKFTQKAQNALNTALHLARELGHTYVGSEHLLLGLAAEQDGIASKLLDGLGVSFEQLKETVSGITGIGAPSYVSAGDMTPRVKKILEVASETAHKNHQTYIGTEYLLSAILGERDCVAVKALEECGISVSDLKNSIGAFLGHPSNDKPIVYQENKSKHSNTAATSPPNNAIPGAPTLSQHGRNLTAMASEGKLDPIVGRDRETERVIQILSRRSKNNPCLIGEPGVGKTAVIEGLAQRVSDGAVPEILRGKLIVTLDVPSMIAGAKYRGEFEERMKNVMNDVSGNRDIILFIDEIHTIIGAGAAEGAVDAANILKPALSRGEIQIIGATTVNEYKRHIEKDAALERRFQAVTVGEPSESEAIHILEGLRDKYEAHHQLRISNDAIKAAVNLSKRYISDRFLPDKAIDLIDEAASKLRLAAHTTPPLCLELEGKMTRLAQEKEAAIRSQSFESAAALRDEEKQIQAEYQIAKAQWDSLKTENSLTVTEQDIADIVTQWTGIPLNELVKDDNEKLLQMENRLNQMVIGQSSAIEALSRAIRRGRLGLKDPRRPIGSFLFLGPTGVGKTELTKALSFVLFGDVNAMIRLDMSEYMEKHSISKLIGSPPGYVGYDEGGQLTEKVRRRPYSVILFDEIEKGHPDVFHLLLQILEDGVLTDAQGRHVNFKNTILIMTSNLGASSVDFEKKVGFSSDFAKTQKELLHDHTMRELKRFFRPEFLNRIDETIIFNSLSQDDVKQIALNMLNELSKRVRENIRIELEYDEKTVDLIVEKGYDATNGARPLRRAIMYYIEDRLSDAVLRGEVMSGSKIRLTCENGKINFQKM